MEQRQHHRQAVRLHRLQHDAAARHVVQQVAVRQHRPLRPARRARRVNDHRQVPFAARTICDLRFAICDFRPRKLLDLKHFELRTRREKGRGVNGKFLVCDDHVNAAILQDVIHLIRLEEIVDGHKHRVSAEDAEHRRDEFRPVFEPQADAVAGLDAKFAGQLCRHGAGLGEQRGIGEFAVAPVQGDFVRLLFHRSGERRG